MGTHCFKKLLRVILIGSALTGTAPAFADNPSTATDSTNALLFELDGNTADPVPATLPDDWEDAAPNGTTLHASATTNIVTDSTPRVFTQGSKDINGISTWAWRSGSSPSKADLQHAYAAAYQDSNNHLITYFGSDRLANTGTVSSGFWFFRNRITVNNNGKFNGVHANGDILVTAEYDNGGHVGTIAVYKWVGNDATGSLQLLDSQTNPISGQGLFCDLSVGGTNNVCGITNGSTISIPWVANGSALPGIFYEGGIDLSAAVGEAGCFASFMATTRSSTTGNAEIKNFVVADFPVCHLTAKKFCDFKELVSSNQARFTVSGNVKNDGSGTVFNIGVSDSPAFEATPSFFQCDSSGKPTTTTADPASLAAGASICYQGTITLPAGQSTGSDAITATANTAADNSGTTVTSDLATATCTAPSFEGSLDVTKNCSVCLEDSDTTGRVVLQTSYSGQVCNPNTFPITSVTISDIVTGATPSTAAAITVTRSGNPVTNGSINFVAATKDSSGAILTEDCVDYTSSYFPAKAFLKSGLLSPSGSQTSTENPDTAATGDTVSASGKLPFASTATTLGSGVATCLLCRDSVNPCTKAVLPNP